MIRAALWLLASLFWTASAQSEPVTQTVEEHRNEVGEIDKTERGLVHRSSGYVFPFRLADVPARDTTTYGPADSSAYYTLDGGANGDVWITLYVYPATVGLDQEKSNIAGAIVERFKAVPAAAPATLTATPAGVTEAWFVGAIEGKDVLTGYRLTRSGNWFIKARITIPEAGGEPARARAFAAISAINWNVADGRQAASAQMNSPLRPLADASAN